MKKIILFVLILTQISCSRYALMTKDKYDIIYRDNNLSKVKAKFENAIDIEMVTPDTIVSIVDDKGKVTFDNITRSVSSIPSESKVKIVEYDDRNFKIEFIEYKLTLLMVNIKDDFYIKCNKDGVIEGTQFKIKDNNPKLLFKLKNKNSSQTINLKKN
jgi:hypothetical protein